MNYRRLFIENSFIFITIVTSKRRKILVDNIDILKDAFKRTVEKYNYQIFAICVLPDHIHMIIKPYEIKDYPKIIQQIKRYFSQNIDKSKLSNYTLSSDNIKRKESDVWQHRYWEHTICNEDDLNKHTDYIHYNPMKHYNIAPKDWKYSSFKKFVKNEYYDKDWFNFDDKHNINDLNYE